MSNLHRTGLALVAAIALMTGLPGLSAASTFCPGASEHIPSGEADCVSYSWRDAGGGESRVTVNNSCSDYGKVKTRVQSWYQISFWTINKASHTGLLDGPMGNVLCCKHSDTICDLADAINSSSCSKKFNNSPAGGSCILT